MTFPGIVRVTFPGNSCGPRMLHKLSVFSMCSLCVLSLCVLSVRVSVFLCSLCVVSVFFVCSLCVFSLCVLNAFSVFFVCSLCVCVLSVSLFSLCSLCVLCVFSLCVLSVFSRCVLSVFFLCSLCVLFVCSLCVLSVFCCFLLFFQWFCTKNDGSDSRWRPWLAFLTSATSRRTCGRHTWYWNFALIMQR